MCEGDGDNSERHMSWSAGGITNGTTVRPASTKDCRLSAQPKIQYRGGGRIGRTNAVTKRANNILARLHSQLTYTWRRVGECKGYIRIQARFFVAAVVDKVDKFKFKVRYDTFLLVLKNNPRENMLSRQFCHDALLCVRQ